LYFLPLGDSQSPHPAGVCSEALELRNQLLKKADEEEGSFHEGICQSCFPGMLFERPRDELKIGYYQGGWLIVIKSPSLKIS